MANAAFLPPSWRIYSKRDREINFPAASERRGEESPPPSAPRGDKSSIEIQSSLQFLRLIARLLLLYYYIDIRIKSESSSRDAFRHSSIRNDRNDDNKIPIKSPIKPRYSPFVFRSSYTYANASTYVQRIQKNNKRHPRRDIVPTEKQPLDLLPFSTPSHFISRSRYIASAAVSAR